MSPDTCSRSEQGGRLHNNLFNLVLSNEEFRAAPYSVVATLFTRPKLTRR